MDTKWERGDGVTSEMQREEMHDYRDVEWEPSAQVIVRTTDPR